MKKPLLLLTSCLLSFTAPAQWVHQPYGFPTSEVPMFLKAVDANTVWVGHYSFSGFAHTFSYTYDGGQNWIVNAIAGPLADESTTSLTAVNAGTAWVSTANGRQGRVWRTTDGGNNWRLMTTPAQFASSLSWPNFVHFFTAGRGVVVGDADVPNGSFEVYTSQDGGLTWARATSVPAALSSELGSIVPPAAFGNSVWFLTTEGRVLRSTDQGLTWAAGTLEMGVTQPTAIAFRDAQLGLVVVGSDQDPNHRLYRSTDGGATWSRVLYSGPLHATGLKFVPGTNIVISTGADLGNGDQGSSISRDNGQTWTALESTLQHTTVEAFSAGAVWSGRLDASLNTGEGVNRLGALVLGARPGTPRQPLEAYPNPSRTGVFTLPLPAGPAGEVQVTDALGRVVLHRTLAAATGRAAAQLDLSRQAPGVYTLALRTAAGIARQKLVIE